jgi:hypothetical protein
VITMFRRGRPVHQVPQVLRTLDRTMQPVANEQQEAATLAKAREILLANHGQPPPTGSVSASRPKRTGASKPSIRSPRRQSLAKVFDQIDALVGLLTKFHRFLIGSHRRRNVLYCVTLLKSLRESLSNNDVSRDDAKGIINTVRNAVQLVLRMTLVRFGIQAAIINLSLIAGTASVFTAYGLWSNYTTWVVVLLIILQSPPISIWRFRLKNNARRLGIQAAIINLSLIAGTASVFTAYGLWSNYTTWVVVLLIILQSPPISIWRFKEFSKIDSELTYLECTVDRLFDDADDRDHDWSSLPC